MDDKPKYIVRDVSRHGEVRLYFRRQGHAKIRINSEIGTPEFAEEYAAALGYKDLAAADRVASTKAIPIKSVSPPNTLRWLWEQYSNSSHFRSLEYQTRRVRELVFGHCLKEPVVPGDPTTFGDFPISMVTAKAIRVLRDRKKDKPGAANSRLKFFSAMFAWAVEEEVHDDIKFNPVRDVKRLKPASADGWHAWTLDEIELFERHYEIGTTARLALALLLYTGQRNSDVVRLGRQHVRDGWLYFTQFKNRNRDPHKMEIPIIAELQRIIDASTTGDLTYLMTAHGKPFTAKGFGNRMRKWCDDAGLPICTAHGLRKAATERLALLGCSDREIMSITGHKTVAEVDRYARGARRRQMAASVLDKSNVVAFK